jgi:hypothetical protein
MTLQKKNYTPHINKRRDPLIDAVKGFLILCIVLEHNSLLTVQYDWIRPFCDAFAAGCFLILTFAWKLDSSNIKLYMDKYLAYYWPFFIFLTATSLLYSFFLIERNLVSSILDFIKALFIASPLDIKASSGYMYFWFLPCLCFLYLIRKIVNKIGMFGYGLAFIAWLFIGEIGEESLIKTPYSLHVISFIFFIGLCYSKLHNKMIQPTLFMKTFSIVSFVTCSIISIYIGWELFLAGGIIPSIRQPILLIFYSFFMLTAIPGIYHLCSLLPNTVISFFAFTGVHSMKVYLLHPLIYIFITQIIPIIQNPILSFIITIGLSLLISLLIIKLVLIDNFIFPKTLSSLIFNKKG